MIARNHGMMVIADEIEISFEFEGSRGTHVARN